MDVLKLPLLNLLSVSESSPAPDTPDFKRALIILNPTSGQHKAEDSLKIIAEALEARGITFDYKMTEGEGDATNWAKEATNENYDLIVAAGGDGTVMEVIAGLISVKSEVPVLVAPLGTGNILSRVVDLPFDLSGALKASLEGYPHSFDVGHLVNADEYFMLSAGTGIDADVVKDADRDMKNKLGFFAYVVATFKNLSNRRSTPITLELDGKKQTFNAHTVIVFNASQIHLGAIELGPGVNPHDGMLDIAVMHESSALGTFGSLWRLFTGQLKHEDDKPEHLRARHVRLESTANLSLQADGEELDEAVLDVEVLPEATRLLVPRTYSAEPGNQD